MVHLLDIGSPHLATANTRGCKACIRVAPDFHGSPGGVRLWAPVTHPTWIRGSTSSSSSRPCSILSSSSSFSSASRAGGGSSAGSSERLRFIAVSMWAAECSAAGSQSAWWDWSAPRAASPPQPGRSGRAARPPRVLRRRVRSGRGSGRGCPLSAAACSTPRPLSPGRPDSLCHPTLCHKKPSALESQPWPLGEAPPSGSPARAWAALS